VASIFDNWQLIVEDLPNALNAQRGNDCSPADANHELHYSLEAAGWAAANKPRGAEQSILVGTPASHV